MGFNLFDPFNITGIFGGGGGGGGAFPYTENKSNVVSGAGFKYPNTLAPEGFPYPIHQGYGEAAGLIMRGTELAEQDTIGQYEAIFQSRLEGGRARQRELETGLAGEASTQGLSQDTVRLLSQLARLTGQGEISAGAGDARAQMLQTLAGLKKGTGTELAGLKLDQVQQMLDFVLGQKAERAAEKAAKNDLLGAAIGAGGALGGAAIGASG